MNSIRAKWAAKIMRARYFVILTDKESVIYLKGLNPHSFDDTLSLAAQSASLQDFGRKLKELLKEHEAASDKLFGGKKRATTKKTPTAKRTKINVKKG